MSDAADTTRISDGDRQAVVDRLRKAVAEGRLTLDEFSDRVGSALDAKTAADLEPLTKDLPTDSAAPKPRERGLMLRAFGMGSTRTRWKLPKKYYGLTIFGDGDVDLQGATLSGSDSKMTFLTLFGGTSVVVPPGVNVETGGFALFGSNKTDLDSLPPVTGGPTITINMYTFFGGGDVNVAP